MKKKWDQSKLESVNVCPYCSCVLRNLAHKNIEDWSFNVAPGLWSYYQCNDCSSLYLDPRPDRDSIGEAYENYYTHAENTNESVIRSIRGLIKNDWLSYLLGKKIVPQLNSPRFLIKLAVSIFSKRDLPFWMDQLILSAPGKFLDMGSGSGNAVLLAKQVGWESIGIDFDPLAVEVARKKGLTAFVGSDELLSKYQGYFDYVLCSHVLEHVHNPRQFIDRLCASVKPSGVLVITLPNSTSSVREYFGDNWRGLEAPRHLSIPSQQYLIDIFISLGFTVDIKSDDRPETVLESLRLQRRGCKPNLIDRFYAKYIKIKPAADMHTNDFIKLVCKKLPAES